MVRLEVILMYINEAAKVFGTTKKAIGTIAGSGIPGESICLFIFGNSYWILSRPKNRKMLIMKYVTILTEREVFI